MRDWSQEFGLNLTRVDLAGSAVFEIIERPLLMQLIVLHNWAAPGFVTDSCY
jgi:hypothetical protein